jgi:HPt (histidine-containing phosphotransfer) domain-containing protein
MPVMDGFEAARQMRAHEKTGRKSTPIIALTAHVESDAADWRAAGMNDCVTKPFNLSELAATLARHLRPTSVAAAIDQPADEAPAEALAPAAAPGGAAPPAADAPQGRFDAGALENLKAMQSGSTDLVGRALDLFAEHSREAMLRIARAAKGRDAKEIASAAHALKSMAFNVGARPLGEACAAVERRSADIAALPELLRAVRKEYSATMDEIPDVRRRYARAAA